MYITTATTQSQKKTTDSGSLFFFLKNWASVFCLFFVFASLFVSRPLHVNGRNIFRANYGECCRERTAMCCRHQRLSLLCAGARWLPGDRLDAHGVRRQSCAGLSWRKSDSTQYQVRGFLFGYLVPSQLLDQPHNCRVSSFLCRAKCFFDCRADGEIGPGTPAER